MIGSSKFSLTRNNTDSDSIGYTTDSNVKLMLHFKNNVFRDYSIYKKLPTVYSGTSIGNMAPPSMLNSMLTTTGGGLEYPYVSDWDITTSDASIEFFIKAKTLTNRANIVTQTTTDNGDWAIYIGTNGSINVGFGSRYHLSTAASLINTNIWYHVLVTRVHDHSSGIATVTIYIDGVSKASGDSSYTYYCFNSSTNPLKICKNAGTVLSFDGYISMFRFSKGINQYASGVYVPYTPFGYTSPPIDQYTKLALHFDNNLTDSSVSPKSYSNSSITFDNSVRKYGYSGNFNGSTASASAPYSHDFNFGTSDFTMEGWVYFNVNNTPMPIFASWNVNGSLAFSFLYHTVNGNQLMLAYSTTGSDAITSVAVNFTPTLSTWYHLAFERYKNTGYFYINGTMVGSATFSGKIYYNTAYATMVGSTNSGSAYFNGKIDEFRVSNIARYKGASSIVVPTSPYFTLPTALTAETHKYFRHYRLVVTAQHGAYTLIDQIQLYNGATLVSPSNMTGDASPSPYYVTASVSYEGDANWRKFFLFDSHIGAPTTAGAMGWNSNNGGGTGPLPSWVSIDLGDYYKVTSYKIYSTFYNTTAPQSWTLYASRTGAFAGEETAIHSVAGAASWGQNEVRTYTTSIT